MALNKLYREATRFDPTGRVRLVHVDAQDIEPGDGAIGGGHHYFHYNFIPHDERDIYAATNQVTSIATLAAAQLNRMTAVNNGNSVTFTSTAEDASFVIPVNVPGGTFTHIRIEARWVTPPAAQDTGYQVYYTTPNHGQSAQFYKAGARNNAATDIGGGWVAFDIDMTVLTAGGSDWVSSQIQTVRFDMWANATGALEVRAIDFMNRDQNAVDEGKLGPKSIFFGGQQYDFWPFEVSGLGMSTGQPAEPSFNVADIGGVITRLSLNHEQLLGAKVEIIDTFAKFLDNGSEPDPEQKMVQTFYIDSQPGRNPGKTVTFTLVSPTDLEGMVVPRRQIMNMCEWAMTGKYASGDGCTWNLLAPGIKYYDDRGNEVIAMEQDRCGGYMTDCLLRFGQGHDNPKSADLDYGGFPGSQLIGK